MLTIDPQSLSQVLVNAVNARNGAPGPTRKRWLQLDAAASMIGPPASSHELDGRAMN